jgi:hypothetical protein
MTVELIANALLYGLILSAVLGIVMLASFLVAPDMWVGDYPPDIKAKYGEMGPRARRFRPLFALLFFGSIIVIVMLSLRSLQAMAQSDVGFWGYFLSAFVTLMVFNLFDLLIADWLVFVKIQPKAIILPGTEGMAGYKDYAFHFRGFLVGIVFSAVGALVFSLIALALFSFSSF